MERIRKWRLRGLRGGGERSLRRKGKAFFSGDARSRGVLPTWALAIGQARADVPSAARARTAARAVPPWKLERRARSRGLPRPRSPPANPLLQSLFAPNWPRPFLTRPSSIRPAARGKRVTWWLVPPLPLGPILHSSWKRRVRSQNGGKTAARSPPARLRPSPPPPGGGGIRGRVGGWWVVAGVGGLARWERGGRVDGSAVPRSALRRAMGGGGERAWEASSGPLALLAFSFGCTGVSLEVRRGWGDLGRGGGLSAARLRIESESGMAGLGGSGWEEAVGEGRGRAGTSGRASRRAAATLTLIRCRVTKWRIGPQWPPSRSATRKERGDWKEEGGCGPAENAANGLLSLGRIAFPGVLPSRSRLYRHL